MTKEKYLSKLISFKINKNLKCDIDVIGKNELNLLYDAEIPSIIYNIFKELNLGEFTINVSNRKILRGFIESLGLENLSTDILRMIDKFDKISEKHLKQL